MEQKEKKLGFFARLKKAIFELEDYGFFLGEKLTVAFKYFFEKPIATPFPSDAFCVGILSNVSVEK